MQDKYILESIQTNNILKKNITKTTTLSSGDIIRHSNNKNAPDELVHFKIRQNIQLPKIFGYMQVYYIDTTIAIRAMLKNIPYEIEDWQEK